jgi:hypothetical protein
MFPNFLLICSDYDFAIWLHSTFFSICIEGILKNLEFHGKTEVLMHFGVHQFLKDMATALATAKLTKVIPDRNKLMKTITERKTKFKSMIEPITYLDPRSHLTAPICFIITFYRTSESECE